MIICGSRKYKNINLDPLVDSFDWIVRHNMLMQGCGYGQKLSSRQIINSHINRNIDRGYVLGNWNNDYGKEYKTSPEVIEKFYNFTQENSDRLFFFEHNNGPTLFNILPNKHRTNCMPRVGMAYLAHAIDKGDKPFLIGYSISEDTLLSHSVCTKEKLNTTCHNPHKEIEIIKYLHNEGKLDATFCCIEDKAELTLNDTIEHTEEALEILRRTL
tara:strand:- start:435 stop:1076 length:642 start_codon:yes stop_codon:yes gene_type:complete